MTFGETFEEETKRRYGVQSIFYTLQGEGVWAGTPAVFLRLTGCNVWSGREEDRRKHTKRGLCAAWCDTEFRVPDTGAHGGKIRSSKIMSVCAGEWLRGTGPSDGQAIRRRVVITGGEPGLQLSDRLVGGLKREGWLVHVETNGSMKLPTGIDWITLSPKPPMEVIDQRYDEVKCIFPAVDPKGYRSRVPPDRIFIQPQAHPSTGLSQMNIDMAKAYVLTNPWCRLSLQTHKILELP